MARSLGGDIGESVDGRVLMSSISTFVWNSTIFSCNSCSLEEYIERLDDKIRRYGKLTQF